MRALPAWQTTPSSTGEQAPARARAHYRRGGGAGAAPRPGAGQAPLSCTADPPRARSSAFVIGAYKVLACPHRQSHEWCAATPPSIRQTCVRIHARSTGLARATCVLQGICAERIAGSVCVLQLLPPGAPRGALPSRSADARPRPPCLPGTQACLPLRPPRGAPRVACTATASGLPWCTRAHCPRAAMPPPASPALPAPARQASRLSAPAPPYIATGARAAAPARQVPLQQVRPMIALACACRRCMRTKAANAHGLCRARAMRAASTLPSSPRTMCSAMAHPCLHRPSTPPPAPLRPARK